MACALTGVMKQSESLAGPHLQLGVLGMSCGVLVKLSLHQTGCVEFTTLGLNEHPTCKRYLAVRVNVKKRMSRLKVATS